MLYYKTLTERYKNTLNNVEHKFHKSNNVNRITHASIIRGKKGSCIGLLSLQVNLGISTKQQRSGCLNLKNYYLSIFEYNQTHNTTNLSMDKLDDCVYLLRCLYCSYCRAVHIYIKMENDIIWAFFSHIRRAVSTNEGFVSVERSVITEMRAKC